MFSQHTESVLFVVGKGQLALVRVVEGVIRGGSFKAEAERVPCGSDRPNSQSHEGRLSHRDTNPPVGRRWLFLAPSHLISFLLALRLLLNLFFVNHPNTDNVTITCSLVVSITVENYEAC